VLAREVPGPWLFSDSTVYARQAAAILAQGWGALGEGAQDYTILYPLLIAPAFLLDGRAEAHQAVLAINALVSTSTVFPLYWISRRLLPARVSLALTAVVALLPSVFVYTLALSSENLFLSLFWWGTFLLLRLAERDRTADAVAAGLAIGLLPAVKLTGFAILAAAAVLVIGMALFHRVDGSRSAACLVALFLPQLAWVFLRDALGGAERGLFGFGPGVGESLVASLGRIDREGLSAFLRYFVGETTYFMVGAYVAWIAFSLYLVSQYRTWQARSIEGFLLLWTCLAAAALVLVTVFFLFPIAQSLTDPEQQAREIYGRFIEVLFPAFFILGTRGMIDFAWKERSPPERGREFLLLLAILFFTAVSFYPLTGYSVSSPFRGYAFDWLGRLLPLRVETLLAVLFLPSVLALGWLVARPGRGRRAALALALGGVVGMHVLVLAVTLGGVVRAAQVRDARLFRIGPALEARDGPRTRIVYDAALGFGDQYFSYRFWSDAKWEVLSSDSLLARRADYVVTRRRLGLPLLTEEANGVRLYGARR
jgi:4-amino-4-deoxy-L-arabinose transferase-like glycosyltransferase